MNQPKQVRIVHKILNQNGYKSYIVGGCVRDTLLGVTPKDWDMCTDALPNEIVNCFKDKYEIIETGIKHGTVTVVIDGMNIEITTFRLDGEYKDKRHPVVVIFKNNIGYDLSRRDFTINAMAYNDIDGIIDPYGGALDLKLRRIKCVGVAEQRFQEDALRILRALRLASVLNFEIEEETSKAIHKLYPLLSNISAERIQSEFIKFISGKMYVLSQKYVDVLTYIFPPLLRCVYQEQGNKHALDVYKHMMFATEMTKEDDISLALFFHDISKPECYDDRSGVIHFPKHNKVSAELAKDIMKKLKFSNKQIELTYKLILYHCEKLVDINDYQMKLLLNKCGKEVLQKLLTMQRYDVCAKLNPCISVYVDKNMEAQKQLERILSSKEPYRLSDLVINGNDVCNILNIEPGPTVRKVLECCLDKVMKGELKNVKEDILEYLEVFV